VIFNLKKCSVVCWGVEKGKGIGGAGREAVGAEKDEEGRGGG